MTINGAISLVKGRLLGGYSLMAERVRCLRAGVHYSASRLDPDLYALEVISTPDPHCGSLRRGLAK
jgi:hypothetical protein